MLGRGSERSARLVPEFTRAKELIAQGILLRLAAQAPSRALVVSIDLALGLAGPVERIFASSRYPDRLDARRRASPPSFAPSVILEHEGGVVSSIVPIPHAETNAAHRIAVSLEGMRLDLCLPCGGLTRVIRISFAAETATFVEPRAHAGGDPLGRAMTELATAFIDAVDAGQPPHAPWTDEVHVREVWEAVVASAKSGVPSIVRSVSR